MSLIYVLDLIGTFVFAISGLRLAAKKDMDLFGAVVVAFVTAVGGGTTRDILIGNTPVSWMQDIAYPIAILAALPFTLIFKKYIVNLKRTFFIFDTMGIALFTISGMQKGLVFDLHPSLAMVMGMVSATVGGVIRDILCNEIPLIFRKEIYATACLLGALVYYLLDAYSTLANDLSYILTVAVIIAVRILSIKFHWSLPKMK
ncbi:MAG: trimeric intracellular cation channel family protein [Bacteroidota bacterium]